MVNDFRPFKGAMAKLSPNAKGVERADAQGQITVEDVDLAVNKTTKLVNKSYEIYLSLYQAVTGTEEERNIYKQFSPEFFDLIIVDECHRGSAREDSKWREILEYFKGATHIGLTATPKETKEISSSEYFGDPLYTYSLKQGIDDGFLAPYKVIKVTLDIDAEVQKALDVIERIETACGDPVAREQVPRLLSDLGVRIGLTFREGRAEKNRKVRRLQGGIIAFGNRPLPCVLRNGAGRPIIGGLAPEESDHAHNGGCDHGRQDAQPDKARRRAGDKKTLSSRKGKPTGARGGPRGAMPHSPVDSKPPRQPPETGRLSKVSRGDPRRAFPDEAAPSQNAREIHRSLPVPLPVPDLVRRGCGAGAIGVSA
jgi:hypothetical protein